MKRQFSLFVPLSFLVFALLPPDKGEGGDKSHKRRIEKINEVKEILSSITHGIPHDLISYFSREVQPHPLPKLMLSNPIFSLLWQLKTEEIIRNLLREENFSGIFYIVSRYYADVKRINLLSNPAQKYFRAYPDPISAFTSCISDVVDDMRTIDLRGNAPQLTPDNFHEIDEIEEFILSTGKDNMYSFLKKINTFYFRFLLCAEKFRKEFSKKITEQSQSVYQDTSQEMINEINHVMVYVYGRGDDVIVVPDMYPAVIIDLGGNDLYIMRRWWEEKRRKNAEDIKTQDGGNNIGHEGISFPVLAIIDFGSGKDKYSFSSPRQTFYLSYVFDSGGDDLWECDFGCGGAGILGAELVVDMGGDDMYVSRGLSFGAGMGGVGILTDMGGNDTYKAITFSQGAGVVGGGALLDAGGDDRYILLEGKEYPSFQNRNRNLSAGQGCGFGLRADFLEDDDSIPGGVGILFDLGGNDSYSAEVFGQACGYWYGIGLLLDSNGDDSYKAHWYCQGSSAHFGVGLLSDLGGNDTYICERDQGLGHGHDLGIGVLFDFSGNDKYYCGRRCLGMGHANGLGIFIDAEGKDVYRAEKNAFGDAITSIYSKAGIREIIKTFGVFLDLGEGEDSITLGKKKLHGSFRIMRDFIIRLFLNEDEKSEK